MMYASNDVSSVVTIVMVERKDNDYGDKNRDEFRIRRRTTTV
jgi:hypothetical protein